MNNPYKKPSGREIDPRMLDAVKDNQMMRASQVETVEIHKSRIVPDPGQPRKYFPKEMLLERLTQLHNEGQKEPITVWPGEPGPDGELQYQLIDGECRWRSVMLDESNIDYLRAQIDHSSDRSDIVSLRISQLIHNNQGGEDLRPFEEAQALAEVLEELKGSGIEDPQAELARRIGKHTTTLGEKLKLAQLPENIKEFALHYGINDSRAIGDMLRIHKLCPDDDLFELQEQLKGAIANGVNMRKTVSAFLKEAKQNKASGKKKKTKSKKSEKKMRQLAVREIELQEKDDGALLILETPREFLKLSLTSALLEKLKAAKA